MGIGVVATFLDPGEAQIAAGALRSAGFHAVAMDSTFSNMDWIAQQSLGGIRVGVPDSEVEEAARFLAGIIRERPKQPPPTRRGVAWHILAMMIGALVLLSWAMIRPEHRWQQALMLAGASAPALGWTIVAAVKSRSRSNQLTAILLAAAAFAAVTAVVLGLGWLLTGLPHWLYPHGRV